MTPTTEKFVEWEERFSVGVPLIDSQHKQLIAMTNELHNACRTDETLAKEQFGSTVREAVAYVKYHFSTEEQIMEKIAYPVIAEHKKIHAEFVQEVLKNVKDFEGGKKFVPNHFVRFLRDWILSHVALNDSKLGAYIVGRQSAGQLGKITMAGKDTAAGKKIVLAVDDEPTQLAIYKNVLTMYDVYTCASPLQALEISGNMDVDIILLDLKMPEISGYDFLQRFKNIPNRRQIPVIVVSGYSEQKHVAASVNLGAADFISKPVDPELLIKKVKQQLEKHS